MSFSRHVQIKSAKAVLEKRRSAKYYSLIVDATPDSSHTEQTTFVFRYAAFNEEEQECKVEDSMVYVDFSKKTGEEIANMIQNFLSDNSIPLANCRSQGYDNGANMAGKYKGVKAHLLERIPWLSFLLVLVTP
eukprot:gene1772-16255_t